ncbi:hypothetical protein INR49_018696 [Caranx melampygus]|nr:hypothetical protein INR49_018696 [Caranx melampygus]
MASVDSAGSSVSGRLRSGDLLHAGLAVALLLGVWSVGGLEVSTVKEVDNTLTVIIVSVLGGVIGLVIIVMVIKALVVHFLLKDDEKNKECLVSSSGNDNTENGLSGAKADNKGTPKA